MVTFAPPSPRSPDRGPCRFPCPPLDLPVIWALFDSATAGPWWVTWPAALALSTLARFGCRWLRARLPEGAPEADPNPKEGMPDA